MIPGRAAARHQDRQEYALPDVGPTAVLPRRPLTVGELLDSAVLLLRGQGRLLIPLGALLAVGEQLLLLPLRHAARVDPPTWWPELDNFGWVWLMLAVGAGTEAVIITLLGNPAARAAGAALLGRRAGVAELLRPRGARWGATLLLAPPVGALVLLASLAGPVWLLAFGMWGSLAAALVLDRVPAWRALDRAAGLALRGGARAAGIRLLGYLGWWLLRVGLALGAFYGLASFDLLDLREPGMRTLTAMAVFAAVNAVAYPALACLDAVLHLDNRMRTEGLDIRLSRSPAGLTEPVLLAADR
ncbi:hypothetical protein [Micromonospora halophytica]|uniref:Uncharacterized protein n=1 Tax=Micromonospora halophytica TaxID=47864 RepID=A0A1C5HA10_9ACTN|nr:hypothetical protein [Micromonospora halophytica]SCG42862.1 hypothetical protein GA0070560_103358 [Micromonospora halophytica]